MGHAPALKLFLPGYARRPQPGSGGDDDRPRSVAARVTGNLLVIFVPGNLRRLVHNEFHPGVHCLFHQGRGQLCAGDSFGKAGEVLDTLGVDNLRAAHHPLNYPGGKPVAGGIHTGRHSGQAPANN